MGFYQNAVKMMLGIAGKSREKMSGVLAGKSRGDSDTSGSSGGGRGGSAQKGGKSAYKKKVVKKKGKK